MSGYNIQSPFAQLGMNMFSPSMTAQASAGQLSDIAGKFNPYMIGKAQLGNSGTTRNVFGVASNQGMGDALRHAAPVQQQMGDEQANAQWQLQRANANEGFTNNMLSRLYRNYLAQNDPNIAISQQATALQYGPQMLSMLGQFNS